MHPAIERHLIRWRSERFARALELTPLFDDHPHTQSEAEYWLEKTRERTEGKPVIDDPVARYLLQDACAEHRMVAFCERHYWFFDGSMLSINRAAEVVM